MSKRKTHIYINETSEHFKNFTFSYFFYILKNKILKNIYHTFVLKILISFFTYFLFILMYTLPGILLLLTHTHARTHIHIIYIIPPSQFLLNIAQ